MSKYKDVGQKVFVADKETQDAMKAEVDVLYKAYTDKANDPVYGFIEHNAVLDPSQRIEYIGANRDFSPIQVTLGTGAAAAAAAVGPENIQTADPSASYDLKDWKDFPWLLANKPWMVRNDGTPDYPLDPEDYTKKAKKAGDAGEQEASDIDNVAYDGGAFSWARKIYKKEYMEGTDRVVLFCMSKRDGFEPIGFVDPDGNELEGMWIPMFYGSLHVTESTHEAANGLLRSLAGAQPWTIQTTDAQGAAISKVGARAHFFGGALVQTLVDLEIMFAKTTDLQGAYGKGNCSGNTASDKDDKPTDENGSTAVNRTENGVLKNKVVGGGQFYGSSDGQSLNKIFHSIVLGSYNVWCRDPYMQTATGGRIYVSPFYKGTEKKGPVTENKIAEGWVDTGINCPASNGGPKYPSHYRTIAGFGSLPVLPEYAEGTTATGGCDGVWWNSTIQAVSLRFGDCGDGDTAGGRALTFNDAASDANWAYGVALLLFPPVGVTA